MPPHSNRDPEIPSPPPPYSPPRGPQRHPSPPPPPLGVGTPSAGRSSIHLRRAFRTLEARRNAAALALLPLLAVFFVLISSPISAQSLSHFSSNLSKFPLNPTLEKMENTDPAPNNAADVEVVVEMSSGSSSSSEEQEQERALVHQEEDGGNANADKGLRMRHWRRITPLPPLGWSNPTSLAPFLPPQLTLPPPPAFQMGATPPRGNSGPFGCHEFGGRRVSPHRTQTAHCGTQGPLSATPGMEGKGGWA